MAKFQQQGFLNEIIQIIEKAQAKEDLSVRQQAIIFEKIRKLASKGKKKSFVLQMNGTPPFRPGVGYSTADEK